MSSVIVRRSPGRPFPRTVRRLALPVATVLAIPVAWAGTPTLPRDLGSAERARLAPVTSAATLSTRFDATPFPARPDVFEYLLDHPEFATHVTRALKLARYRIWRQSDGLFLDDGWGARGTFEVVHRSPGVRVMYARGGYEQRMLPNINGEAVVIFEYAVKPGADGHPQVAPSISSFVKLDGGLASMASRVAPSLAREKADKEAQRLAKVFMRVSRAIDENPARVYDLVRQRSDVPARDLEGFRQILNLPKHAKP
jgi:hypothetical protein